MRRLPDCASFRSPGPLEAPGTGCLSRPHRTAWFRPKGHSDMGHVNEIGAIREYHAHVYFDAGSRERAAELRTRVEQRFTARIGPLRDGPAGPHLFAQYSIAFGAEQFSTLVPFLMMNRMGLTLLVHPLSGRSRDDHTLNAMWAGGVMPVNLAFLREADVSR